VDVEHPAIHQTSKFAGNGEFADAGIAVQYDDHVREPIADV